jgi:GxxExxY protein
MPSRELTEAGIAFARQVALPIMYKGAPAGDGFTADIIVADELILEIKAVSSVLPTHKVQLRTYLRMSGIHAGLLPNSPGFCRIPRSCAEIPGLLLNFPVFC